MSTLFDELNELIAACHRRGPGKWKHLHPRGVLRRERMEELAAQMRARYGPHQGVRWDYEFNRKRES